jgi:plasmid stability protein
MASLTVRHLDEKTKSRIRARAAQNGRSMEAEVREILDQAVAEDGPKRVPGNLADRIRAIVEPYGGFELPEIKREPPRDPPTFD